MNIIWITEFYQDDDSGASAMEYAILMSLIASIIISGVAIFGSSVHGLYDMGNTIFNKTVIPADGTPAMQRKGGTGAAGRN